MTSPNPIVGSTPPSSGPSSSSSAQNTPSNVLGPDSFITLLTAQLQAQDPLSPMDPDQMVNELTSINTLQQIVQIRSDMDTLVSSIQGGQSSGSPAPTTPSGSATNSANGSATNSANGSASHSVLHTAAKLYSQLNSLNFLNSSSQSN